MDDKIAAIQNAINRLADLSASINKDIIDDSSTLTNKVTWLIESLREISVQARSDEHFGKHGIPVQLLEQLNDANSNPDIFTVHFVEGCAEEVRKMKAKANYMEEMRRHIEAQL